MGDKHGESTTLRLQANPGLLQRVRDTADCDIRLIHVVRDPYDNISTIREKTNRDGRRLDLEESIAYYFSLCETVLSVRTQIAESELFEVRHEAFVDEPERWLVDLCRFLGVSAPREYLDIVVPLVFPATRKSRHGSPWTPDLIEVVRDRIAQIPFLTGYAFDD